MMKIIRNSIVTVVVVSVFLSGCGMRAVSKGEQSVTGVSYAEEIDKNSIMTFEISVDEDSWLNMLENALKEEYISADITINGDTISNVGIRPKGNSSLSSIAKDENTDRYSFKIKFDEYVDGQTWKGLDKIVLNSNYSDATSMKEYLSYDIMSYIGVNAPLFSYADISVNGETWGFYLAVEDMDSGYLDRVYDGEGELYKPDNDMEMGAIPEGGNGMDMENPPAMRTRPDMENPMESGNINRIGGMDQKGVSLLYTGDELSDYSAIFDNAETKTVEADHQRIVTALKNLNQGTELETYVDVDAVLRYFAAHTVVVNLDSYISNMGHNYYLYEKDGKISILPWDYNLAFGGFQSQNGSDIVNFPIDTPVSGVSLEDRPLLGRLLEVSEYKERYHAYLKEIMEGYFNNGQFVEKIERLDNMISAYVEKDPSAFYTFTEYKAAIEELKILGTLRGESIQGQLAGTIPSTAEAQEREFDKLIDGSMVNLKALGSQGGDKRKEKIGPEEQMPR